MRRPYRHNQICQFPVFLNEERLLENLRRRISTSERITAQTRRQSPYPNAPALSAISCPSDRDAKVLRTPRPQKSPRNPYPARCPCLASVHTTKNRFARVDPCLPTTGSA